MHTLYVIDRSAEKTLKRDSSVKYDPYQEKSRSLGRLSGPKVIKVLTFFSCSTKLSMEF